jgi:hypothetical protein
MARGKAAEDLLILEMALIGYQVERQKIEDKIGEIKAQLGGKAPASSKGAAKSAGHAKRVLSAAARARISAAQKKRWAAHRRLQAAKK